MLASLLVELHQLRYLVSAVEEGSFTAAAAREHLSQSGISAQVAKLEREVGQRLLQRGRTIRLTAAGEAVLPLARAALAATAEIEVAAAELSDLRRGKVRMGMILGCAIPPFLDAVASFQMAYPGVDLGLREDDSDRLQAQVLAGELDMALVGYAGQVLAGLTAAVLVDEPLAAIVPEGHRWAGAAPLELADLTEEPIISLRRGTGVRGALDASCAVAGLDLRLALEASSPETILGLARRGAGVAVLSQSILGGEKGFVAKPLRDAATTARLGIVTRTDRPTPAARELHRVLTEHLTHDPIANTLTGNGHANQ